MQQWASKKHTGFTIVELLIVIVVIAILAAITIVAYTGIQERANNTAIVDGVGKIKRAIEAYAAANNTYPYTADNTYICVTTDSTCRNNSAPFAGNAVFDSEIAEIATVPRSVPLVSDVRGGVSYQYWAARTVDGRSAPVILNYYVFGVNTSCGYPVLNTSGNAAAVTASTPYTAGNVGGSGATHCAISVNGPGI